MDSSQLRKRGWPDYLAMAVIAAAVGWQLMVPPVIGIADNGDFPRIMSRFDIGYLTDKYKERYFAYFLDKYRIDKRDHWESKFVSSQTPLVAFAVQINRLITRVPWPEHLPI
jgi:hypothetical protein